jgi:hypothetical protein
MSCDDLARERLEDLRRLQAEFVNYKNRTARERDQLRSAPRTSSGVSGCSAEACSWFSAGCSASPGT